MVSMLILLAALAGAAATGPTTAPAGAGAGEWKLVFADEFERPGGLDPKTWTYETGMVRNHEAQLYTDARAGNARVEGGCLVIEARKEDVPVPGREGRVAHYTSASVSTSGRAEWRYGKVEVRAKIPTGRGTWPAIWFLPDRISEVGWPACGEIDLMENVGYEPGVVHQSVHTKAYNHVRHTEKTSVTPVEGLEKDFHVYALEWTPDEMTMSIDGVKRFAFANEHKGEAEWPFDHPFHVKLNLAIGGD